MVRHRVAALVARADPFVPGWFWAFFKFGAKGGTGLLLNIVLLTVVVDVVGVPPQWAVFIVWAATLIPGYVVMDRFVFSAFPSPSGVGDHGQRGALHYAVMWSGKGANYVIYYVLLSVHGMPYQVAWGIGAVAVVPWTFGGNYWLWKKDVSGFREALARVRRRFVR